MSHCNRTQGLGIFGSNGSREESPAEEAHEMGRTRDRGYAYAEEEGAAVSKEEVMKRYDTTSTRVQHATTAASAHVDMITPVDTVTTATSHPRVASSSKCTV